MIRRAEHLLFLLADVITISGHRLSTAEIMSVLIMHKGIAETWRRLLVHPKVR
jgi:hypothetical protein